MTPLPRRYRSQPREESGADRQQLALLDQVRDRFGARYRGAPRRQRCALLVDESANAGLAPLGVYDRLGEQLCLTRKPLLQTLLPTRTNRIDDAIRCLSAPDLNCLRDQTLRFRITKRE